MEISKSIEQEKQLILKNFLKNAAFDKWSIENLNKSCQESGFAPEYALLLFPLGIEDLTQYFHQTINEQMEAGFTDNIYTKVHEKIIYMIELKFALYDANKEAMRSLVKYNLKPQNILKAKSMLWQTCDKIWCLAGDKSTDYNFYTKRTILAAVYSASLVYWISDDSEDFAKTRAFIRNRIRNVLTFGKLKESGLKFFKKF